MGILLPRPHRGLSPCFLQILKFLEIVFFLQPALHSKFREYRHHLPQRNSSKLRGLAE